ncbi:NAC domain-containing protein 104-like [Andrographis paniculata]|uniref:NAC domain-containing protein 104-like n=1 Tax=Andrographis paniculata TaxID=175694 RepID=UPI0021E79664|nr:NAC domain-containing protein 104-like [Andrographis paniculata]
MGDHNSNTNSTNFNLPPGFRFYPTDEELVVHFLHRKAALLPCHPDIIPDLDLYPYNPWDLNGRAMGEGNKWYYYSRRTSSSGERERWRMSESGYWESIGVEEPIYSSKNGKRVGIKKCSVFYIGDPPHGIKTHWVMQEFMLSNSSTNKKKLRSSSTCTSNDYSRWVVCRVYECGNDDDDDGAELSCLDEVFLSLDDLDDGISNLPN